MALILPSIQEILFFPMRISSGAKDDFILRGAVLIGEDDTVLGITTPCPSTELLFEQIRSVDQRKQQIRMKLVGVSKKEFLRMITDFCNGGHPLPNAFDKDFAQITGLSAFQKDSYRQTCLIPHGETRSYSWLSERLRKTGSERAMGGSLRSNPFPMLIPCHRVIKKDGKLGGFMGMSSPESWQLKLKRLLLELEEQHRQPSLFHIKPASNSVVSYGSF